MESLLKCSYCTVKFSTNSQLVSHQKFCKNKPVSINQQYNSGPNGVSKVSGISQQKKVQSQRCNYCKKEVAQRDYWDHLVKCRQEPQIENEMFYGQNRQIVNRDEDEEEEEKRESKFFECPSCKKQIPPHSLPEHLDECLGKKIQKKPCEICGKQQELDQYDGHVQRCKTRNEYRSFMKNHREEKKKDIMTESMLQDPNIAFLPCIYCQQDIVESRYEEHLLKCETEEKCSICSHSYPKEVISQHQKMCELNFLMQMGGIQPMVQCQKCQKIIPASVFEAHQFMHFQEDGFDGEVPSMPELEPEVQTKIDKIFKNEENQRINNMTEDELYKYFHDVDLNEFQEKNGLKKDQCQDLNKTFYIPKNDEKEENKLCLICQEDFGYKDEMRRLPCQHQFHLKCVDEWLSRNAVCPVCRKDIKQELEVKKVTKNTALPTSTNNYNKPYQNKYLYPSSQSNNNNNLKKSPIPSSRKIINGANHQFSQNKSPSNYPVQQQQQQLPQKPSYISPPTNQDNAPPGYYNGYKRPVQSIKSNNTQKRNTAFVSTGMNSISSQPQNRVYQTRKTGQANTYTYNKKVGSNNNLDRRKN